MSQNMIIEVEHVRNTIREVLTGVKNTVTGTMGPNGHYALIANGDSTQTTKDGVTVARAMKFDTALHELINRVICEPAIKTDEECGDGTTTTILLTYVIETLMEKYPGFINHRNIEAAVKLLIAELITQTKFLDVNDDLLYRVALTSSNQDEELANKVIDVYRSTEVGYPDIEVETGRGGDDIVQRVEGRVLRMYYASPAFGTGSSGGARVLDTGFFPVVLDDRLLEGTAEDFEQAFANLFASISPTTYTPVVLVVRSAEVKVITELYRYMNKEHMHQFARKDKPSVYILTTNMSGTIGSSEMQDLSVVLDAPMVTSLENIADRTLHLNMSKLTMGMARSKIEDLSDLALERIEGQISAIQQLVSEYTIADKFSLRARVNEQRMRNLRGQVVSIYVGGETNQEIKERKDRYVDVVKAVKSALENGILPGAGMGILNAARAVGEKDFHNDVQIETLTVLGTSIYLHLNPELKKDAADVFMDGNLVITNLATGETGTSEEIGVWDTAYATITALKGGLQTAKILANAHALINTNKLVGRTIDRS